MLVNINYYNMDTLFYFREDLLPFYIWGFGGIVICVLAILRIRRLGKKFKITDVSDSSLLQQKHNHIMMCILAVIIFYLLSIIPILSFLTSSSSLYIIGGVFFVGFGLMFYLLIKK